MAGRFVLTAFAFVACKDTKEPSRGQGILGEGDEELKYFLKADGESYSVSDIGTVIGKKVVIPSEYEGKPVTSIGDAAFYGCSSPTEIKFNGTVAQWNAISNGLYWNNGVPATKVICSDGEVAL